MFIQEDAMSKLKFGQMTLPQQVLVFNNASREELETINLCGPQLVEVNMNGSVYNAHVLERLKEYKRGEHPCQFCGLSKRRTFKLEIVAMSNIVQIIKENPGNHKRVNLFSPKARIIANLTLENRRHYVYFDEKEKCLAQLDLLTVG